MRVPLASYERAVAVPANISPPTLMSYEISARPVNLCVVRSAITSTYLPLIRSSSATQMPLPSLSLACGSPAAGFACCIVPSALKTYM
jgi:hypothetical protein